MTLSELSVRRTIAFLGSAGLFVWILVLFFSPGATFGDVPVPREGDASVIDSASTDIECTAISSIADGKDAVDWPLDDDGERSTSTVSAVDAAGALCDRFRDARSTHMTLLAVPTIVLGVYALWGPKRWLDEDDLRPKKKDTTETAEPPVAS